MKKVIAGWLATVVRHLDPTLGVFNNAVEAARRRSEDVMRGKWRTVDWHKALRFEAIEGGDPTCEHVEVTAIKKYRTKDWTQKCNKCGATLTLHNVNLGNQYKPYRKSTHYLTAKILYLHECFAGDPIVKPIPFEDINDDQQRRFFALAERYL